MGFTVCEGGLKFGLVTKQTTYCKSTILQYKKKEMTSVATGKLVSSSGLDTCSVFFYEMVTQLQPQEEAEETREEKKKETNFLYSGDMTHHKGPQRSTG